MLTLRLEFSLDKCDVHPLLFSAEWTFVFPLKTAAAGAALSVLYEYLWRRMTTSLVWKLFSSVVFRAPLRSCINVHYCGLFGLSGYVLNMTWNCSHASVCLHAGKIRRAKLRRPACVPGASLMWRSSFATHAWTELFGMDWRIYPVFPLSFSASAKSCLPMYGPTILASSTTRSEWSSRGRICHSLRLSFCFSPSTQGQLPASCQVLFVSPARLCFILRILTSYALTVVLLHTCPKIK